MHYRIEQEIWPLRGVFRISRGGRTQAEVVTVRLEKDGAVGRGECVPYPRYGETTDSVRAQLEAIRPQVEAGADLHAVQTLLKPGAARNALDCAMWDLQAKTSGKPVWHLAGLASAPKPVLTAYTISLDTPASMAEAAIAARGRPLLKIKLGGEADIDRVKAVVQARPDARLIVDANEGLSGETLPALRAALCRKQGSALGPGGRAGSHLR
jgi:L-Ala-D/L-Glu epimerase